jgi:hypothetical protein
MIDPSGGNVTTPVDRRQRAEESAPRRICARTVLVTDDRPGFKAISLQKIAAQVDRYAVPAGARRAPCPAPGRPALRLRAARPHLDG